MFMSIQKRFVLKIVALCVFLQSSSIFAIKVGDEAPLTLGDFKGELAVGGGIAASIATYFFAKKIRRVRQINRIVDNGPGMWLFGNRKQFLKDYEDFRRLFPRLEELANRLQRLGVDTTNMLQKKVEYGRFKQLFGLPLEKVFLTGSLLYRFLKALRIDRLSELPGVKFVSDINIPGKERLINYLKSLVADAIEFEGRLVVELKDRWIFTPDLSGTLDENLNALLLNFLNKIRGFVNNDSERVKAFTVILEAMQKNAQYMINRSIAGQEALEKKGKSTVLTKQQKSSLKYLRDQLTSDISNASDEALFYGYVDRAIKELEGYKEELESGWLWNIFNKLANIFLVGNVTRVRKKIDDAIWFLRFLQNPTIN